MSSVKTHSVHPPLPSPPTPPSTVNRDAQVRKNCRRNLYEPRRAFYHRHHQGRRQKPLKLRKIIPHGVCVCVYVRAAIVNAFPFAR